MKYILAFLALALAVAVDADMGGPTRYQKTGRYGQCKPCSTRCVTDMATYNTMEECRYALPGRPYGQRGQRAKRDIGGPPRFQKTGRYGQCQACSTQCVQDMAIYNSMAECDRAPAGRPMGQRGDPGRAKRDVGGVAKYQKTGQYGQCEPCSTRCVADMRTHDTMEECRMAPPDRPYQKPAHYQVNERTGECRECRGHQCEYHLPMYTTLEMCQRVEQARRDRDSS